MLTHNDLWNAIDQLAAKHRLSTSGLARVAGLDPTTFNKSKRGLADGKRRWPSTESLAKVLDATGATLSDFVGLVGRDITAASWQNTPLLRFSAAQMEDSFDSRGRPSGEAWSWRRLPRTGDPKAFAIEIDVQDFAPIYRKGDQLLVSPLAEPSDRARLLIRLSSGDLLLHEVLRHNLQLLEVQTLQRSGPVIGLRRSAIAWTARVLWTSQ